MSVFNGDDYQRGWNEGRKAALEGKDRSFLGMGRSWKFAIHGRFALDRYTDGYKAGYEAGLNEKNVVRKVEVVTQPQEKEATQSFTSTGTTSPKTRNQSTSFNTYFNQQSNTRSMDAQRIELQLEALRQLEQFLRQTVEDLRERMQQYNDRVSALRSDGLTLEIADNYDANYCIPNNQKLWQVTEAMVQNDLQYIHDNIAHFEELLEIARRNYNN